MTLESAPPPNYSQGDSDNSQVVGSVTPQDPQILIIPTVDTINFQKGFLGADGERAAIEGELQIKETTGGRWAKITVSLRTVERAYIREIELNSSEVVLFSSSNPTGSTLPSIFPFAIPLTPDTPQCVRTPHSSLSHTLTATLYPSDPHLNTLSKTIAVQTKRFTSHAYTPATHPETHNLDDPTRIEVQVPRTTFRAGEPIPVYATIPSPRRELVVDQGLRLRNVRVELIQVVKVKRPEDGDGIFGPETNFLLDQEERYETHPSVTHGSSVASSSTAVEKSSKSTSSKEPDTRPLIGASYRTVVAHSGASCRFHSSKPVRLRFILHQPSPSASPSNFQVDLPSGEYRHPENDIESAPITQTTLLHSITFRLNVHVSFVNMSTHMERFSTVTIPVVIIAPPATLPEVEGWLEAAYQKKHDRPPAKTVRHEDSESSAPHYEEGEAGPSFLHNNAPPPFEERDAPPPFFSHAAESSTSGRLPTFLESEAEIIIPAREDNSTHQDSVPPAIIPGEGTQFGFPATLQFDGHSEDMQRSSTPPPTVEMASRDTDLTNLTDINEGGLSIEALGLALERHEEAGGHHPPPPPPAMDDPSDPPPSIDSHFRTPAASNQRNLPRHPSSPQLHSSFVTPADPPPLQIPARAQPAGQDQSTPHGYAPPPYLIPEHNGENEQVSRPPPYMG